MGFPTFDIEAINWVTPIAVGFYDGTCYQDFFKTSEDDDIIWFFLQKIGDTHPGIKLYAHNAANYDNRFILDSLTKHNQTVRFLAGLGKIYWVEKEVSFEDSYLLLGRGLAACCRAFDVPNKLTWDHESTVNIWEMEDELEAFRDYLRRDCLSLSQCVEKFYSEIMDKFNVVPSSTLSLTAVKAFSKNFFPVDKIASNEQFEKFIREATFGGRNEVYKKYGEDVFMYDVRRMYVSCYDVTIPIGNMRWTKLSIDEGVLTYARVKVPEDLLIGPLPFRYGESSRLRGRLIFPVGEFEGWWDHKELKNAVENYGVDVKLMRQLICEEEPVLDAFGKYVGKLSQDSNSELARIWKLLGLRLSGKLGQHRLRTEVKHISEIEDQTGYYPIDGNEVYQEKVSYLEGSRSPYIKPTVNMRIRAEARIRHLKYLTDASKKGNIYYCDTDSVHADTEQESGPELGQLRLIDRALRAYYAGCKFYGYINRYGIMKQRSAGFRDFQLTEPEFQRILDGEEIEHTFTRLGNWREQLKGQGVKLIDRQLNLGQTEFSNRITSGIETRPHKLKIVDGKVRMDKR